MQSTQSVSTTYLGYRALSFQLKVKGREGGLRAGKGEATLSCALNCVQLDISFEKLNRLVDGNSVVVNEQQAALWIQPSSK